MLPDQATEAGEAEQRGEIGGTVGRVEPETGVSSAEGVPHRTKSPVTDLQTQNGKENHQRSNLYNIT